MEEAKDRQVAVSLLRGTPYLIGDDADSGVRFRRVQQKSADVAERARRVGTRIQQEAVDVFESFGLMLRSEIVAESNQMEYYDWSPGAVRELVVEHRDLLALPAHSFLESIRLDEHAYQALGLYRAQLVVDEWADANVRPREIEIRQLHSLITKGEPHAGRYKYSFNEIGGAKHKPPAPAEAAEGMFQLARWWETGSGDPALDATVAHAWLAHLHPFEDGNGRVARLLANLALSQGKYPPLIISAASDRGEYYDALAASDDGDILPLFDLFARVLRRSVKVMSAPDYVERVIQDRLLVSPSRQRELWQAQAEGFVEAFRSRLRSSGWDCLPQGYPTEASFSELAHLSADGNSWFLKVQTPDHRSAWLLWFGFNSQDFCDLFDGASGYPSIFLSVRNEEPQAVHPYTPVPAVMGNDIWSEIVLVPGRARPARIIQGFRSRELTLADAATYAAEALITSSS